MAKYTKQRLLEMMNRVGGMPLTEIDWEGEFSDVSKECISVEELKNYFPQERLKNLEEYSRCLRQSLRKNVTKTKSWPN